MDPCVVERGEMALVGLTADMSDICGLWTRLVEMADGLEHRVDGTFYELHRFLEGATECTVGVEVSQTDAVPGGMCVMHLPAGQYAVFSHRLANGGYEGLNPAMDEWLRTGPYEQSDNFIVEVFDERFRGGDQPDSEIDFLIPVRPRS